MDKSIKETSCYSPGDFPEPLQAGHDGLVGGRSRFKRPNDLNREELRLNINADSSMHQQEYCRHEVDERISETSETTSIVDGVAKPV